ncbi:hypothetical protein IVB56_13350 [Bradyrhizobium sp. CW7]|uniref:hypothetical protein n=1 Tax=Bradyrhizobium sp. CW7 TaxID=2782688 RepID=UPI001FFB6FC1|nr:hypothetical protein [Bradyrhizobium sp. CW7]MCK1352051.1 hypothetical protein [Bradyrhizobium sp. CW7]
MHVNDLSEPNAAYSLHDGRREVTLLEQLTNVHMPFPRWVIVPIVALHALECKEDVGAPHVVSEREAHDHSRVVILELIAAVYGTPMRCCGRLCPKVISCGHEMFHPLVHDEKNLSFRAEALSKVLL